MRPYARWAADLRSESTRKIPTAGNAGRQHRDTDDHLHRRILTCCCLAEGSPKSLPKRTLLGKLLPLDRILHHEPTPTSTLRSDISSGDPAGTRQRQASSAAALYGDGAAALAPPWTSYGADLARLVWHHAAFSYERHPRTGLLAVFFAGWIDSAIQPHVGWARLEIFSCTCLGRRGRRAGATAAFSSRHTRELVTDEQLNRIYRDIDPRRGCHLAHQWRWQGRSRLDCA